ncbi:MAG: peptidase [Crocinitomicaceae bacterium]|nr:peptidase [Crocinitomicaceae bacterium]
MSFKFGKTSLERLSTCHQDLVDIMNLAIQVSSVDFGIAEGHRSVEKQQQYFREDKSKIDGITKLGKHNYHPSLAVDIYPYVNGKAEWDNEHLSYLSGVIEACANILVQQGRIGHRIRWGGNWDMDGAILIDQSFDDRPHFELIKAYS